MTKCLTLAAAVLLAPAMASADAITRLYVFGDSLLDQGNASILAGGTFPPSPYADGRASNGPIASDYLAERLGVALTPSLAGGTNYAVIGAATGPVQVPGTTTTVDNIAGVLYGPDALAGTGLQSQVQSWLITGGVADPDALFLVWSGANDIFIHPSADTAGRAAHNVADALALMYGNGARRFLVPNMANLSLTPAALALPPDTQASLEALALGFNAGLNGALDSLSALPGIEITRFDTFALLTAMAGDPRAFGFTYASPGCLPGTLVGGAPVCVREDEYVFWDDVHPTTRAHRLLGEALADAVSPQAVPEPAALTLLAAGAALVIAMRRRRAG